MQRSFRSQIVPEDNYAALHNQFMLLQRRMRQVRLLKQSPLHYVHGLVLNHLATDEDLVATDIAQEFDILTSKVSRILAELDRDGYIIRAAASYDRRKNVLRFTEKGVRLLTQLRTLSNEIAREGLAGLSAIKQGIIVEGLRKVADGMGVAELPLHPGDHPLVPQQQRLIRAQAVLSSRYMGSAYTLSEYHLLMELALRKSGSSGFDELATVIPLSRSRLSRVISQLEKRGVVAKTVNPQDRRKVYVRTTVAGKAEFDMLQKQFSEVFQAALAECPSNELQDLQNALQELHAIPLLTEELATDLRMYRIENEEQRLQLRSQVVEYAVRKNIHTLLPETLIGARSTTTVATIAGQPVGFIETIQRAERPYLNLFWIDSKANGHLRNHLAVQLFEAGFGTEAVTKSQASDFAWHMYLQQGLLDRVSAGTDFR